MKKEENEIAKPTALDIFEAISGEGNFVTYEGDAISAVCKLQIVYSDGDGIVHYLGINKIDFNKLRFHVVDQEKSFSWLDYYSKYSNSRLFIPEEWGWKQVDEIEYRNKNDWELYFIDKGLWYIAYSSYGMYFKISTVRDYINLTKLLQTDARNRKRFTVS